MKLIVLQAQSAEFESRAHGNGVKVVLGKRVAAEPMFADQLVDGEVNAVVAGGYNQAL
jgi:hypothetical protein